MKLRILFSIALLALLAGNAKAWNCSNPLDARVDVGTTKPSGKPGDADGQYFLGTGTEGTKGHYYVCETPKTPTDPSSTLKQKQKQQQQQNQTSSSTATGGSSVLKNAGNSAVTNSGNSSNSNTNTANSTASAANNGNGSNNTSYNSETNIAAVKIPVETAYAPTTVPTMSCFKTYSAGAQTSAFGISAGGGKVDPNCQKLQTAMHATNQLVFCKIFITTKDAREAGVTLDDCLGPKVELPVVIPAPAPAVVVAPVPVAVVTPEPTPVVSTTATQTRAFNDCSVPNGNVLTNVCKAELRDAARAMVQNPGAVLHITAPQSVVNQLKKFLASNGVQHGVEWGVFDDQNNNLSLYLTWTEQVS